MAKLYNSVAFRLAFGYGALVVAAMVVMAMVFYIGTVGVIARGVDDKLAVASSHLTNRFENDGVDALSDEIRQLLSDGIDQDTEAYLLLDTQGRKLAGNLSREGARTPLDQFTDQEVHRYDRSSFCRLLPHRLSNGDILVVGRDLHDLREITVLVLRALVGGGIFVLILAALGAILLRRLLDRRIAAIRRTAGEIEAGDLSRRIPVGEAADEFSRLGRDINRMLDRIQNLMEGVRDVSNAIAHDLRTPLGRVRGLLDEALRDGTGEKLRGAARLSIDGIDDLVGVFEKLLQIAEAESGTRRQSFAPVTLKDLVRDIVELYDATAEANGITLIVDVRGEPVVLGDRDLLMSAVSNLLDNALKYAGIGATVRVSAHPVSDKVSIDIRDNGPGISPADRKRVLARFYRVDRSRSQPGNGLGLSIVVAICHLHDGTFELDDAAPGLIARITLPAATLLNGNVMETAGIGVSA